MVGKKSMSQIPVKTVKRFSVLMLQAVDLLDGMLLLDPEKRLTAKQGLSHPFLVEYHDQESEPDPEIYDDSFENLELDIGEWKSKWKAGGHCVSTFYITFIATYSERHK